MEIKFTTLAKNKEEFDIKLTTNMIELLKKIAVDNTKILTIQFEDVRSYIINNYIDTQFCRHGGTYLFEGKFYWRDELYKIIQPYCKTCLITVAEKELYAIKQSEAKELNKWM